MNFRCQIGPLSECFMLCLISDWKSHWTDGFLKDLNCFFFFQKPRKSKNALYYQKNIRFLSEIDQKVPIVVEKLKK